MWLSLRKASLLAHLVLREKPIWSIEAAVILLCWTLATPDLQLESLFSYCFITISDNYLTLLNFEQPFSQWL